MPVESFVISLLDEETDEIEGVYLVDDDKRAPITRIPRDQGLSGRVIITPGSRCSCTAPRPSMIWAE
jgi:hypothetical protein